MATAAVIGPMSSFPVTAPQTRPVLRRATYVHVSDLTSAYNIDHAKLEQELSRVKGERELSSGPTKSSPKSSQTTDDIPAATTPEIDPVLAPTPHKRLQPPRGGYNLCVRVGKVTLVVDKRRVDQSRVRLAEVEIGDETGTVSLRARDEQIDTLEDVSKLSGAVVLRNCTLELYQGKHIRLAVTKWGKLSVYPDNVASTPAPPSKMNYDRNFSLIDLSAVASEMVHPDSTYGNRPSRGSENPETTGRQVNSKTGGPSHSKHQQAQSSQRRTGRDRRQSRGKPMAGTQPLYAPPPADIGMQAPGAQMRYHSMHAYPPPYEPGLDMRQYSYPHSRQQEQMMPPSSAQMMLQRQYELQQRQFHQMYHGQQERHRQSHQAPGMILQPLLPSGSFDTTGEYPGPSYTTGGAEQHPPVMPVVGSSPVLIPMSMAGSRVSPIAASTHHDQYGASAGPARPGSHGSESTQADRQSRRDLPETVASGQHESDTQYMSVSPDDSQFSPGKMNPEATAFAPAYMGTPSSQLSSHQVYFPFDPSQSPATAAGYPAPAHHHPAMYSQGLMYAPSSRKSSKSPSSSSEGAPSSGNIPNTTDSKASGKKSTES